MHDGLQLNLCNCRGTCEAMVVRYMAMEKECYDPKYTSSF